MSLLTSLEDILRRPDVAVDLAASLRTCGGGCEDIVEKAQTAAKSLFVANNEIWCTRDIAGLCKDCDTAVERKELGAKHVRAGEYLMAAAAYSQALIYAPQNDDEGQRMVSVLLANRALCLLKNGAGDLSRGAYQRH